MEERVETHQEDEYPTILTQDDEKESHVFSIRTLPSRKASFSKRHREQSYARKQQVKVKQLASFKCFDPSLSSPDYPYKEVDRKSKLQL